MMRKIVKCGISLALATALCAPNAHPSENFKNCTKSEVVARVCAPTTSKDYAPVCDFVGHNRSDDSGYGKILSRDFNDQTIVNKTSRNALKVNSKNYERFLRVFAGVKSAYIQLFDQMQGRDKAYFMDRISELKAATQEDLSTNPIVSILSDPGAYYSGHTDKIYVSPVILNYPEVSEVELEMIIAHEIGHFLDPDISNGSRIKKRLGTKVLDSNSCLVQNFLDSAGGWRSFTHEDYADWMASTVARALMKAAGNKQTQKARALNWAYAFCEPMDKQMGLLHDMEKIIFSRDSHSPGSERIITLMEDPYMLSLIGCGPKVINEKNNGQIYNCNLWSNDEF